MKIENMEDRTVYFDYLKGRQTVKKIIELFRTYIDISVLKFLLVGIVNTIVGTAIMFIAYNNLHFDYWLSSALNYILTSILSYFLNKYFTFKDTSRGFKPVLKFALNIGVCYVIAYGVAKPVVALLLSGYEQKVQDNGAMFAGMCLFVVLNYLGQRFFAFGGNQSTDNRGEKYREL